MGHVTGLYAVMLAVLFLVLSLRVVVYRRGNKISLGDGNDPILQLRIRAQGNFSEYAPFGLVLMLIAEAQGTPDIWLHICGSLLVIGRVMHGANFTFGLRQMPLRVGGMVLTFLSLGLGALMALPL
jgi:uncharacterized protein